MTDDHQTQEEGLIRTIGTRALGLNIINMVVGGGIFVLPGIIAAKLGSAAIIAYLVCSVAVALVFLCFAEVGSRVTRSGGAYAYIEDAFGPFAGFVASLLFWFGWSVLSDAAIAVAMVETISIAVPDLAEPVARALFIIALFVFLAAINIVGVKSGVRFFVFTTIVKLVPLVLLAVVGIFAISADNLAITEWPAFGSVGAAALVLFFAFAGAESGLSASGEIKDPPRTVPRGLLLGLVGILTLYVGLHTAAQGVLGAELANNAEAPLAATAQAVLGNWGGKMLLVAGVISIFATVSGDVLNAPRVIFASARDGNLPKVFGKVHPKYKTPYIAIAFMAAVVCAFAISGTFKPLAVVASGSILIIYLGVSLAAIRLRMREGLPGEEKFRIPGGFLVPVLSCVVIAWLLVQMTLDEAIGIVALIAAAIVLYGVRALLTRAAAPQ